MIGLKNKSEINCEAAKLLHEKNYYAPSIHCSYYCCLQLMKYSLNSHFKFNESEIGTKVNEYTRNNKDGSHNFFISFLFKEIKKNSSTRISIDFNNKINALKKFRTKADYDKDDIHFNVSEKALTLSNDIIFLIKKYFKI
ncbi:MAG: hypothetical protein GQ564_04695 [Bacteroidales bacterium]|nr:hypothetical protein [Bacteroidales bacterium]